MVVIEGRSVCGIYVIVFVRFCVDHGVVNKICEYVVSVFGAASVGSGDHFNHGKWGK